MKNTDRPQCDDCCRRTAYPALARTIRTLKGLLPSPNTTCGTRTLCHTVPGRLKYTVLQPSSTRGGGGRKAVLAGLPRYTHIRAQSGHQARASAPLPRYTKLSQNLQQRGKPKRNSAQAGHTTSWAAKQPHRTLWLPLAMHVTQLMAAAAPLVIRPSPLATAVVQRAGSSLVSACVTTLRSTLTSLCRELRLVAMKNTNRPQCDDCCRRTAYPALARTIRTLKGLLPSPNTTCGTRTLSHTVPGRLKYTVLQPSSTRGVGGRKAVLADLPRCTHLLAQSGPQARTSAPLPRYTKLSQNLQQRGKPKRNSAQAGHTTS